MHLDFGLDFEGDNKLIIEVEPGSIEEGIVKVRLDSESTCFSFNISEKSLKKLIVAGIRYLKEEPQGCFYHDRFLVGIGDRQKEFSGREILAQHPF